MLAKIGAYFGNVGLSPTAVESSMKALRDIEPIQH
jgi:hypothetical protein